MKLARLLIWIVMLGVVPMAAFSYESAFEATPVGSTEVKTLPAAKVLVSQGQGSYFDRSNGLFMKLFRYIDSHDVKMTVPVQAEIEPGAMWFYVGSKDAEKKLEDAGDVHVMDIPERLVASIGGRGAYSERNYRKALGTLEAWVKTQEKYEATGNPYAIYWSGPYVPAFMKRYEVHIPVREANQEPDPD
jgi:DNA gyrase inhibitor GyrI